MVWAAVAVGKGCATCSMSRFMASSISEIAVRTVDGVRSTRESWAPHACQEGEGEGEGERER